MLSVQKGWKKREEAGLARSKRRLVSPEIRAIRAAHLAGEPLPVAEVKEEAPASVEASVEGKPAKKTKAKE